MFLGLSLVSFDVKVRILSNKKLNNVVLTPINDSLILMDGKEFKNPIKIYAYNDEVKVDFMGKLVLKKKNVDISIKEEAKIKFTGGERYYKGNLNFKSVGGYLFIVNSINIEDYVAAVAAKETANMKNFEAIKANVIAIRTYAIAAANRHIKEGYNFCDLTHCQLYVGFKDISEKIYKAVKDTEGVIITYKGKPIWAMYHSVCGGRTETGFDVWGYDTMPYLVSVRDEINGKYFCSSAWGYRWRTKISIKKFESFLKKGIIKKNEKFINIGNVYYTDGGRVREFEIITNRRKISISGINFYHRIGKALGWLVIKSTAFEITREKKYIIFNGKGYGHGAGMCQAGSDGMAGFGYDYKDILKHYYKDIKIVKFDYGNN
ncbi:MAG: SpoIID/LytB domain-containing protein [Elusimicrobiota bacterium]